MKPHYRWKVIEVTSEEDKARRVKGKVLRWTMTEAAAADHGRVYGRKLEKVPGSEWTPSNVGGDGWGG